MTETTVLTAARMAEIRKRAEQDRSFFPSHADSHKRAEDMLAILAALEAAQDALAKAEKERDEALAEMRRAEGERREALARRKDALDSLATTASARDALAAERDAGVLERANLADRLAEVDAALAKTQKGRDSARAALARLVEIHVEAYDPPEGAASWPVPAWVTSNLPGADGPAMTPGEAEARAELNSIRSRVADVDAALAPKRAPRPVDAPAPTLAEEVAELIRRVETAERSSIRDAARVAELEGALATARVNELEEAERIVEADLLDQPGVIVAAERRFDGGSSERAVRRIAAKLFRRRSHLVLAAAPPEQAPAPPRTDDGARAEVERLQMLILDIRGLCTVLGGPLVIPRPERALATIRELTYRALPSSESTLCDARPADVGSDIRTCDTCRHHRPDAERRCGAGCGWAPADVGATPPRLSADQQQEVAAFTALTEVAPADGPGMDPDMRAAPPASTGTAADLAQQGDAAIREARLLAQAGDPLCARNLGEGVVCGHPLSEHRDGACWHWMRDRPLRSDGYCPCPVFVAPGAGESEGVP